MGAPKGHPNYDTEGLAGRPKIYDDAFIENEAIAFDEWMLRKDSMWYEDFCRERKYSPQRLTEFAKQNERFSEVYERAQYWQKSLLIRGGLLNKFNASITKLVLANTVGWTDKAETKVSGGSPLAFILQDVDGKSKELVDDDKQE